MIVVYSETEIRNKYKGDADHVLAAVRGLNGTELDISDLNPEEIRDFIDEEVPDREEPVCLIGGYDIVPAFRLANPTHKLLNEVDEDVLTDGPYGARSKSLAEQYMPSRAVSRIPDSGTPHANQFIALLKRAAKAENTPTPGKSFEQAAFEFEGSAKLVHGVLTATQPVRFSPPDTVDAPATKDVIAERGRVHILLHGSDNPERWDTLYGARTSSSDLEPALRVVDLSTSNLKGAIVSFSTCYSAMLDRRQDDHPPRDPDNQPALACLMGGAKTVYGSTRANWIDNTQPFDSFGSALIAMVWKRLHEGLPAARALLQARFDFARAGLSQDAWSRPYVLKTLLQAQCYGHPLVAL